MSEAPPLCAQLRKKTIPGLLAERARSAPEDVAYRAKNLGIYRERTWADYAREVARCAVGLQKLGLARSQRVAIMGDSSEEWMLVDIGAQAAGAITYGIYPTASQAEVEYQMADGGATLFVAEDQEYVDKVLPIADRLPALQWIIVIDASSLFAYSDPRIRTLQELLDMGEDEGSLETLEQLAAAIAPDDPAFIVYTSGTTGDPKGAVVSHGRHLAATYNIVAHYPQLAAERHRAVVYLPLSHILGRDNAITLPLMSCIVPHFGEELEELPQTLFEVAPTALFTVPRYLQKFASQVLVGIANSSPLKRAVYQAAARIGRRHARLRWEGRGGWLEKGLYGLAHWIAFRPILNKLGFDRLQLVLCGGAPLPAETMALWHIWGVNVLEIYGQTETAGGIISGQPGPFARPGDVGTAPAGWQMKLGAGNEILVKCEDLFVGYWKDAEATRAAFDDEGWLRTGDVGEWQRGRLRIVDRARDFIVTAGGKTMSPAYIENVLRSIPYVAEAVVFGHARNYLTALIEIDFDTVADWARSRNIGYTGFTSLARHPDIERLLKEEIGRANERLARPEQIKAFRILPKALDPEEEGEPVTPTRKVKRKLMYERFKDLVDSMYDETEQRLVAEGAGEVLAGS